MKFADYPRRPRTSGIQPLVSETALDTADLVAPVFVDATTDERVPIESVPGHERVSVMEVADRVAEVHGAGIKTAIVFGIPESRDPEGSRAYARNGIIQEAVCVITAETDAYVVTNICLCEYTGRGHYDMLEDHAEDDPTLVAENGPMLNLFMETAVSYAEADADMVTPSTSMDGMAGATRTALDDVGHNEIPIVSHAARYENASCGPFRDMANGVPAFGDRRHYQMDPANAREALREVALDVEQGVNVLMIKPGLPHLDVVRVIREDHDHPVAAYNVSGEYAMLHAAAEKDWLDPDEVARESFLLTKRADTDLIITYFVEHMARQPD